MILIAAIAVVAEISLRLFIPYNPGFYTAVSLTNREVVYPYGVIILNSHGFPDEEFDLSQPHKVGYFGDSVTYGVGAGYGYRVSELLEAAYPQYEHMNVSGVGLSISDDDIRWATGLAARFGMEKVIYLFNLNDIVPTATASGQQTTPLARLARFVRADFDWLRGRSYLYTAIRTRIKTGLEALGYGFHGYLAYEFFPAEHREIVRETAERINRFGISLRERGIELIVVILPYEMQISREAAEVYATKGIHWEADFLSGSTQRIVMDALDPGIRVFDAYHAFVDVADSESSRARNAVGQHFVYDKGDKLDWNHPNRIGHRVIADYLIAHEVLGIPPEHQEIDASATRP